MMMEFYRKLTKFIRAVARFHVDVVIIFNNFRPAIGMIRWRPRRQVGEIAKPNDLAGTWGRPL